MGAPCPHAIARVVLANGMFFSVIVATDGRQFPHVKFNLLKAADGAVGLLVEIADGDDGIRFSHGLVGLS
ncbi:MAG: hypothetical protein NT069_29655 [Planctomycetota bacterium]|nr:hypothetical protein [Planctomycetota bacterium]